MARNTKSTKQTEKPADTKPATNEPAAKSGVGVKELAKAVGRNEKSVRAAIRRIKGGPQVGQGGRYHWDSENDADFVALKEAMTSPRTTEKADDES